MVGVQTEKGKVTRGEGRAQLSKDDMVWDGTGWLILISALVSFLNYAVYHRTVRWPLKKNWKLWEREPQWAKWQPHLSRGTEWNHRNLSPSPSWDLNPRIKKNTKNSHKGSTVTFCESVWLSAGSTVPVLVQTHAAHILRPTSSKLTLILYYPLYG
jgi:hypothetical protein